MDLEAIAPILEDIIRQNLYKKQYPFGFKNNRGVGNKVASGTLARSIQVAEVKSNNGNDSLIIMMEDYGRYVQGGRKKGKYAPIKPLLQWIKDRNLKGRNKKTGRYITDLSFAFGISRNIKDFGIRPADFVYLSIEDITNNPKITELLEGSAMTDLIKAIEGKI
jgi:hypothetical protein